MWFQKKTQFLGNKSGIYFFVSWKRLINYQFAFFRALTVEEIDSHLTRMAEKD